MCGILGYTKTQGINPDQKKFAVSRIARRGPDNISCQQINQVTWFAHTRLAIIDLSENGNQPYSFDNLVISFNGVIYNFKEIRGRLKEYGYDFISSSDTEVLVKAWHLWGPESLEKLNGFFSFAVYDKQEQSLYLCRDSIGKKPLYWREWKGGIAFASQLDALEALTQKEPLAKEAFQWLFYLKYIPEPLTAVRNIFKLERGTVLKFDETGIGLTKWSDLKGVDRLDITDEVTTPSDIRKSIEQAVVSRLIADVPISCLLSGGIDSSIIATLAARHVDLNTFTLAITSNRNCLQFDESKISRQTAAKINSSHHEIRIDEQDALNVVGHVYTEVLDEPLADPATILNHHIFKKVSAEFKVCLTGDGADEVFGGYRRHQGHVLSRIFPFRAYGTRKLAGWLGRSIPDRRESWSAEKLRLVRRYMLSAETASDSGHNWLANTDITKNMFENSFDHAAAFNSKAETLSLSNIDADSLNSLLRLELAMTIPNQMMVKVDKTSMDVGLEVRSPFLDKNVIEKAFSIPGKDKLRVGQGKTILREIFRYDLPEHLLRQRKRGFDLPVNEWLIGPLASNLKDALCPEFQASVGIRKEVVEGWMNAAKLQGGSAASNNLWTLMGLKIWCEKRGQ